MTLPAAVATVTRSYPKLDDGGWANTEIVTHRGTVLAFAQTSAGRFSYSVLGLADPKRESPRDVDAWSLNPQPVPFPAEMVTAGAESVTVVEQPVWLPGDQKPQPPTAALTRIEDRDQYLSTTASVSVAGAPFRVVSDGVYVCLFRQLAGDTPTIVMDRFAFDGTILTRKIEARFQRSRSRSVPKSPKDTLGFEDLDGNPFYEPSRRLDFLAPDVRSGNFTVVLVPTLVPDEQNWQFISYDDTRQRMHCVSIPRGRDGLFDEHGKRFFVSADKAYPNVFSTHPGDDPGGAPLVPWNPLGGRQSFSFALPGKTPRCFGLDAVCYVRQRFDPAQQIGYRADPQPLLGEQRLLLVVATKRDDDPATKPQLLTLDFGVSRDGRLVEPTRENLLAHLRRPDGPIADGDAELDAIVGRLDAADDTTADSVKGYIARVADLHEQWRAKEVQMRDLTAVTPSDAGSPLAKLRADKAALTSTLATAQKDRDDAAADYRTRFQLCEHKLLLFKDENPGSSTPADVTVQFSYPSIENLTTATTSHLPGALTQGLVGGDFQDRASAARVTSDQISVDFYDNYENNQLSGLLFTVDGRADVPSLNARSSGSNDKLSAVVVRPRGADDVLRKYVLAGQTLTDTRAKLDDLANRIAALDASTYTSLHDQISQLSRQIGDEFYNHHSDDRRLALGTLVRFPEQGSTLDGGIAGFMWSENPPRLALDSQGSVAVHFRGLQGQYFVGYLDTRVDAGRAPSWTGDRAPLALALHDARPISTSLTDTATSKDQLTLEAWAKPMLRGSSALLAHTDYLVGLEPSTGDLVTLHYTVHGKHGEVPDALRLGRWSHVALAYRQAYALRLDGTAYLDCGTSGILDITRDLTVEIAITTAAGNTGAARVLSKGDSASGALAYELWVDASGRLHWRYAADAVRDPVDVDTGIVLTTGRPTRIAIVREYVVDRDKLAAELELLKRDPLHQLSPDVAGFRYSIGQDGAWRQLPADTNTPSGGTGHFRIGAGTDAGNAFHGTIAELRVWNVALTQAQLWRELDGRETGLVSWWRIDENGGHSTADGKADNHAKIVGPAAWVPDPDPSSAAVQVFVDGARVRVRARSVPPLAAEDALEGALRLGGLGDAIQVFSGELAEIRIWSAARTEEQIQDNLFRHLDSGEQSLLLYYDGTVGPQSLGHLVDRSGRGHDIEVSVGLLTYSTAPVGADAPIARSALAGIDTPFNAVLGAPASATEYGDMQIDANGVAVGVRKRAYTYVSDSQWRLLTGFKVGDLVLEWVGQAQFDPQVIGFIEGAPPVPSENLTVDVDGGYNGASSVRMSEARSSTYTVGTSAEQTVHLGLSGMAGVAFESESSVGFGAETSVEHIEVSGGIQFASENSTTTTTEREAGLGTNLVHASDMSLTGTWEAAGSGRYPAIGRRFVPRNVGYAVVQSDTVDVFALRMKKTGLMVARTVRKNPDIPRDWNIIMFPINPRYTKQGTLDGKVGLDVDADYPSAAQYSPDSSYFKPIEAYRRKREIEQGNAIEREKYQNIVAVGQPEFAPRDIVNTYVWTADGGLFTESTETVDTLHEVSAGSLSFDISAGISVDGKFTIGKVGPVGSFELMAGTGVTTATTRTAGSETTFGVEVELEMERNIYATPTDGDATVRKQAGKVDAYRFLTFYLSPDNDHLQELRNKIVDPTWLASDGLDAIALAGALRSTEARPWRILHRVTFVSRVMAVPGTSDAPTGETAYAPADDVLISSNYELIKRLEPDVRGKRHSFLEFAAAVRQAVSVRLPASFGAKTEDIVRLMSAFYEVFPDGVPAAGGSDVLPTVTPAVDPVDPAVPVPTVSPDDLAYIHGVGAVYVDRLRSAGWTTFTQLAALTPDQIERAVLTDGGRRLPLGAAANWIAQAALARDKNWAALQDLQSTLE